MPHNLTAYLPNCTLPDVNQADLPRLAVSSGGARFRRHREMIQHNMGLQLEDRALMFFVADVLRQPLNRSAVLVHSQFVRHHNLEPLWNEYAPRWIEDWEKRPGLNRAGS